MLEFERASLLSTFIPIQAPASLRNLSRTGVVGGVKGMEAVQMEVLDIRARMERDMDELSQSEDDFDNPMSLADLANSLAA